MKNRVKDISLFGVYAVLLSFLFVFVYGTTNKLSALNAFHYNLYWDWELMIPFVPQMILVYFSLNLLTGCSLFYLRRHQIHSIALTYGFAIVAAGLVFLTLPTSLGFPRNGHHTKYASLFNFLYSVDLPHNLFPSLHVTLAAITVFAINSGASVRAKKFFRLWLCLITIAVVVTHQHHIIDVFGGLLLAWFSVKVIYFPVSKSLETKIISIV